MCTRSTGCDTPFGDCKGCYWNNTHYFKCSICGEEFDGFGNNAQPVKDGLCCDFCNEKVVIPTRILNGRGM